MKVFLDTNIYDFIAKNREETRIRQFFDAQGISIITTVGNILETLATPNKSHRLFQTSAIVIIASEYERMPQSWHQAEEVKLEIQRCRPEWLRFKPSRKLLQRLQYHLDKHKALWEEVRSLRLPTEMQTFAYYRDAQRGQKQVFFSQKEYKDIIRQDNAQIKLARLDKGGEVITVHEGEATEDMFWRHDCLMVWHSAIALRIPESRDYADWLLPYIREDAFQRVNYTDFWLKDVNPDNITRNRLMSLVSYYQMLFKISQGNAEDQNHASIIPDVDVFLTADKRFHSALDMAITKHYPQFRKPVLVDRNEKSAEVALAKALANL